MESYHCYKFLRKIAALSSPILDKITERIEERIRKHFEINNIPGWDNFTVRISIDHKNYQGHRPSDLYLIEINPSVYNPLFGHISAKKIDFELSEGNYSDFTWTAAKDHFERTIINLSTNNIKDKIDDICTKKFIGIDIFIYEHLKKWLSDSQILDFVKEYKPREFYIKTLVELNQVSKIKANARGMVISGRFKPDRKLNYDNGVVYISGQLPDSVVNSLENKPIYEVIEFEGFKNKGKIVKASKQRFQTRLILERHVVTLQEIETAAKAETHSKTSYYITPY
jgi:hypothetical protein